MFIASSCEDLEFNTKHNHNMQSNFMISKGNTFHSYQNQNQKGNCDKETTCMHYLLISTPEGEFFSRLLFLAMILSMTIYLYSFKDTQTFSIS